MGWRYTIDIGRLDLSDSKTCMLGQLYTNFWAKVVDGSDSDKVPSTKLNEHDAEKYGFFLPDTDKDGYDILSGLWVMKIRQLKR